MVSRFPRGFGVHDRTLQVGDHIDRVGKRAAMRDVMDATFGRGPLAGRTGNVFKDDPFFNPWAEGGAFNKDSRASQEVGPVWREEQEQARIERLAGTKEAAQQVIAGLNVLKEIPGSSFTFDVRDQHDRLYISTNVAKIDRYGHGGHACIIIEGAQVSAYGFSQESIQGTTSEPESFFKALAGALATRSIISDMALTQDNVSSSGVTDILYAAIVSGVYDGSEKAREATAWLLQQKQARAARLAETKENAQQVIAGLDFLKELPGSNFTFNVEDHPDRLYISTNVPAIKIDCDRKRGNANIFIEGTQVSAYYFSQEIITGSTAEPVAFLKALESVLVARTIVPALPARDGNAKSPSLDA